MARSYSSSANYASLCSYEVREFAGLQNVASITGATEHGRHLQKNLSKILSLAYFFLILS